MPFVKKTKRIYIPLAVFFAVILSFAFMKFTPFLDMEVQGAESDPVLVDLLFDKEVINTEEDADSLTVYARIRAVAPKEILNATVFLVPDLECEGLDCSSDSNYKMVNLSLMTEACTALDLPEGFDLDGIVGCGDSVDGIWSATVNFLQYSPIGDWKIYSIELTDEEGAQNFNVPISNDTLTVTTEAGERSIAFSNESLVEDTQAPVIDSYVFDKESIDTTDSSESLTMYIRISDDLSGVSDEFPPNIQFVPENDPGLVYPETVEFEFSLMEAGCDSLPEGFDVDGLTGCGDSMDGVYEATVEVPRYSSGGIWNVEGVWNISDLMGNQIDSEVLETSFNNISTTYDTEAPTLKAMSITPSSFNTIDGPQTVTVEMEIEDDLAGVDVDQLSVSFRSILSASSGISSEGYELTEGTVVDGTFVMEVVFPQGSSKGFWVLEGFELFDVLGRVHRYEAADLSILFSDLPLYLLNQGTTEQVELEEDWKLEDWPYSHNGEIVWPDISVRFEAGTVITKEEGGVFAFHRMLATKYDLSTSTGVGSLLDGVNSDYEADLLDCDPTEGCTAATVGSTSLVGTPLHIIKMGIPGLNLSFSKPVTIIVGMDAEYLGSTFVIQTFDEDENKWVEHGTCTVAMVEPDSYEHGGTAYGEIRPVDYPGCSFTTTHASFFSTNVLGLEDDAAGVPKTGGGGIANSSLTRYLGWLR